MIKFSNCIHVIAFFALISFLAYYPAPARKHPAEKTPAAEMASTETPIPQKADKGGEHPALKGLHGVNR